LDEVGMFFCKNLPIYNVFSFYWPKLQIIILSISLSASIDSGVFTQALDSYWDLEKAGVSSSAVCQDGARSTKQMTEVNPQTYIGWAKDIWVPHVGSTPVFSWQHAQ